MKDQRRSSLVLLFKKSTLTYSYAGEQLKHQTKTLIKVLVIIRCT